MIHKSKVKGVKSNANEIKRVGTFDIRHSTFDPAGFTLIETLVAITVLILAVIAPMSLTVQSLKAAYYARDQVTASNLAQEAIEVVRGVRDGQILLINQTGDTSIDIFEPIPVYQDFTVDTTTIDGTPTSCGGPCPALQTDGTLYGYTAPRGGLSVGAVNTTFTRTVHVCYVQPDGSCSGIRSEEARLTVKIDWRTASYPARSITIYENLYRWLPGS